MKQKTWYFLYTWFALPFLLATLRLLALKEKKIENSLKGRIGGWQRIDDQIINRDIHKSLIWFHVASAGEYLQAEPVIERFLKHGYECAVTVSSINGYKWIKSSRVSNNIKLVVIDYLPFDFPSNIRRILAILQPSALIYVKFDLWPNLIKCTHEASIPQYLISGTLQPNSFRYKTRIGQSFYSIIYNYLDGILAFTKEDADRFRKTNPDHENIQVIGDTRFDSVLDRKNKLPKPKLPSYIKNKFIFIVGSCWPPDEEKIFPALKDALEVFPDLLLIIVPHEPTEAHLNNGETFFQKYKTRRLTQLEEKAEDPPRVIMGDTVGILSSLYHVGNFAYVGGAFTTGVHNVMEPSLMEMPVVFGNKYHNASEAVNLLEQGLAFSINNQSEFRKILFQFLNNRDLCAKLGKKAALNIQSQGGAAEKCFNIISQKVK